MAVAHLARNATLNKNWRFSMSRMFGIELQKVETVKYWHNPTLSAQSAIGWAASCAAGDTGGGESGPREGGAAAEGMALPWQRNRSSRKDCNSTVRD